MEESKVSFEVPGQPMETMNYETYIKEMFVIGYPDFIPLEGALRMTVMAYMMIPKSTSKNRMKLMIDRIIRPDKKPDWDSLGRIVSDALEGLAYKNDSQIVTGIVHKWYAIRPRLEIEITGAKI